MLFFLEDAILENEEDEIGIQECELEPGIEAALVNVYEQDENYNRLMEAIGIPELKYYQENGKQIVYTEANLENFKKSVKKYFFMAIEKIKGLFEKFKQVMDRLFLNDKDFVNKYGARIKAKSTDGLEYKGYNFSVGTVDPQGGLDLAILDIKQKISSKYGDFKTEEYRDALRGKILKKSESFTSREFSKELYSLLRSGESSKGTITINNAAEQLGYISDTKTAIDAASKAATGLEKSIKKLVADLTSSVKTERKSDDANTDQIQSWNGAIYAYKEAVKYAQIANGALISALKARRAQAKSICLKILSYNESKNSTSSSNEFATDLDNSLNNIVFS